MHIMLWISMASLFKKDRIKLELLTNNDMLMMVEKGIRPVICHAIHINGKGNNKYVENNNKDIESSYLMYSDANNWYGWEMFPRLLVNRFKW